MADVNGVAVAASVSAGDASVTLSGVAAAALVAAGDAARAIPGTPVGFDRAAFKMIGLRTSNGATVHWIAYGSEDLTGTRSPYPGDMNAATIRRE